MPGSSSPVTGGMVGSGRGPKNRVWPAHPNSRLTDARTRLADSHVGLSDADRCLTNAYGGFTDSNRCLSDPDRRLADSNSPLPNTDGRLPDADVGLGVHSGARG